MNTMKLPVYKLDINEWDEETGIEFVSLVESPAIQKDFLAFSETPIKFAIQDEDKNARLDAGAVTDRVETPIKFIKGIDGDAL